MFLIQAHKIEDKITTIHSTREERTFAFATSHLSRTIDHLVALIMNGEPSTEVLITTSVKRFQNRRIKTYISKNGKLVYTIEVTEI